MFKLLRELVALLIGIVEFLLAARFVLKLIGAKPVAQVVMWVYQVTQPLVRPFEFAFPTPSAKGGFVLEFTTLFALLAYAFIGFVIEQVLEILGRSTESKSQAPTKRESED